MAQLPPRPGLPQSQNSPQVTFDPVDAEKRRAELLGLPLRPRDTIVVILGAAAADLCLYDHPGGAGFAALLVAAAALLIIARPRPIHRALLMVILLAAAASMWNHAAPLTFVGCAAAVAFAVRLHQPNWTITETAWAVPQTLMLAPLRLFGHLARSAVNGNTSDAAPTTSRLRLSVFLIPLITCILFILIFIAANPVIEHLASRISITFGEWIQRLIDIIELPRFYFWLAFLLLFAALLRPAVSSHVAELAAQWRETMAPPETSPDESPAACGLASSPHGDFASALATLVCVNVLFLAFNALDSVYLYFKADLPAGITYSDYSRRGCFWLTMALALATAVIGAMFKGRLNFHPRSAALRTLTHIWAAQNLLLAVGALRRLQMYVDYNGLTRLRIVGIDGIILVILGLILMVIKVRRTHSFAWLIRRDLVVLWVGFVALALTPRDLVCWKYNVAQVMAGNLRPLTLLHGQPLSAEALPPLVTLLDFNGVDQAETDLVRKGVAALLGRRLREMEQNAAASWTQFQCSDHWAKRRLDAARDRLDVRDRPIIAPAEEALRDHTRQWW